MNTFIEIIDNICKELNIKVTHLSENWTTVLEKNNKIHYITEYHFDLNNHGIGNIMDDKGLFYDLLKYKNIPIIEQKVIFKDYLKDDVLNYFHSNNDEIIIKANISGAGKEVFKIDNQYDLFLIIDKLFLKHYSISLCPYYDIKNEYRVIVLNNAIKLLYGKIKPYVMGDGINTVQELAFQYDDYYKNHPNIITNPMYIPNINEKVEINFKFNLSSGGKTFLDIEKNLKDEITSLALSVSKNLNIIFASIDIINTKNDELLVMEANSGVTLNKFIKQNINGYDIAYNIYKDAIKLMFKEE